MQHTSETVWCFVLGKGLEIWDSRSCRWGWPFTDTPARAVLETGRNLVALRKELISVALLGLIHVRYWRGVRVVGYWQLQTSGGCVLPSGNRTKSVFYTVGLLRQCAR